MFQLPLAISHGAQLGVVADQIASATYAIDAPLIYVERRGTSFRWSPAHRGGPYPLLRTTAKMLGVDYRLLTLSCKLAPGGEVDEMGFGPDGFWQGVCVIAADHSVEPTPPDACAVLTFVRPAPIALVLDMLLTIDADLETELPQLH
jgi:hypothetical protein